MPPGFLSPPCQMEISAVWSGRAAAGNCGFERVCWFLRDWAGPCVCRWGWYLSSLQTFGFLFVFIVRAGRCRETAWPAPAPPTGILGSGNFPCGDTGDSGAAVELGDLRLIATGPNCGASLAPSCTSKLKQWWWILNCPGKLQIGRRPSSTFNSSLTWASACDYRCQAPQTKQFLCVSPLCLWHYRTHFYGSPIYCSVIDKNKMLFCG